MKSSLLTSAVVVTLCMRISAATVTIDAPLNSGVYNLGLYNELGFPVTSGEASVIWNSGQEVDYDEDGIADALRLQYSVTVPATGRKYSLYMSNPDSSISWSDLYAFTQDIEIGPPSASTPPINTGQSPLAINGMLDVHGNILQFGTLDYNPLDDGTPPGVRFTLNPYTVTFDTAMPRALAIPHANEPARMTWSFAPSDMGLNPPMIPYMTLTSNGILTVGNQGNSGGQISINSNAGTINIGVNTVLTSNQLATGAIAPSFLSLKLGGATSAANGSLAAGAQSSATGQYS